MVALAEMRTGAPEPRCSATAPATAPSWRARSTTQRSPVVARRHGLRDDAVLARPADAPRVHLQDALGTVVTEEPRQLFAAQPAAGRERVVEVVAPVVGDLRAERHRHRHL